MAPNRSQETALMVACKEGHADVVKLLCEARVDDTYLNPSKYRWRHSFAFMLYDGA